MRLRLNIARVPWWLVCGPLLLGLSGVASHAAETAPPDPSNRTGVLMITDFTPKTAELDWYVQNDNVMGGRSQGGFKIEPGTLIFAGSTNTNGGGFSSIRTRPFKADLSSYTGIRLRVKGDGRSYIWQLQTNERFRGYKVSYWAGFDTKAGESITVDIPFSNFYPQLRAYRLPDANIDTTNITELGLYIYDNKDGPVELRVDSVEGYE